MLFVRARFSGRGIGGRWGRHSCLPRIGEWRTFLFSRSNSNPLGGAGIPRTRGFGQTGMSAPPTFVDVNGYICPKLGHALRFRGRTPAFVFLNLGLPST